MSDRYIRGCENSTLANVHTPSCTALGVQTPLYRDRVLYSNEGANPAILRPHSVQNCIAIHACFAWIVKTFLIVHFELFFDCLLLK